MAKNNGSTEDADVLAYVEKRNKALLNLDLSWAREKLPHCKDDNVLLIALHKTRYETLAIPDDLRQQSRQWLEERGYRRFGQMPWPKDGSLPR